MRASLITAWPALSEVYGIHPWDVKRLSPAELDSYVQAVLDRANANRKSRG